MLLLKTVRLKSMCLARWGKKFSNCINKLRTNCKMFKLIHVHDNPNNKPIAVDVI